MSVKQKSGVIYVATRKEHYVAEAFMSAHSVKDLVPDMSITLFTDLPDSVYANAECFDEVRLLETGRNYSLLWAEGQLDRVRSLIHSPYEYTLQLDTDTRVMTAEIKQLLAKLDRIDIAMAICQPDASICSSHYGRSMFNVGLILYKRGERVTRLLQAWEELTRRYFELANQDPVPEVECLSHIRDPDIRRTLLYMDQTSMVQLLSPEVNKFDLKLEILDECWNYRGTTTGRVLGQPVKVDHHPDLRKRLARDIFNRAVQYMKSGSAEYARNIFTNLKTQGLPQELLAILDRHIEMSYRH